ncbi:protoporphyrinogen/coproporphyrinogen oxidase [Leucobacter sp. NPDC058333]|uniref:protoporphyrinogen/coproporphyrinogen oxidase n=1 Tax=Leucobacter sp. NPDC058333 TaxID=3346450 RepID=UPI00364D6715
MATDRQRPRIAVVGGGVSGLTAARDLALAGASVELIESGDRLGGRIRGAEIAGTTIDIGAESFATCGGTVAALIEEIGLGDEIVRPNALGSWVIVSDRALPLPAAGTLGIPATPLSRATVRALGLGGALRAAIEPLLPRRIGRNSDSLADLVRARLGSRALDRLVRPVALGVHSADPSRLGVSSIPGLDATYAKRGSLIAAARDLRDSQAAAGGAVAGLRGGMTQLVAGLETELARLDVPVRCGVPVSSLAAGVVSTAGSAEPLPWQLLGADGELLGEADAVVLAVPEGVARGLVEGSPAADAVGASDADRVEVVALAVDDARLDRAPRGTGVLVARGAVGPGAGAAAAAGGAAAAAAAAVAPIVAKALTHISAKWPERAREVAPGRHLLRLSYGRAGSAPEIDGLDDAEVRRIARADASRILGVEIAADAIVDLVRCPWSMGRPPGSRDARPLAAPPGIILAGDWVSGTGLAAIVRGARTAAAAALEACKARAGG